MTWPGGGRTSAASSHGGVFYCTLLYNTLLYCPVLHCNVLYCTVLCCIVLYCTVLYCTVLYCTVLYCTVLYCTVMYCTVLSAIKAYNGYQPCHKVLRINPAANITFSVVTPETAGFKPSTPGAGGKSSNHSTVRLCKSLGQYPT